MTTIVSRVFPRGLNLSAGKMIQEAVCEFYKRAEAEPPTTSFAMAGRLYASKSGWILLSVPNALVRGVFDSLQETGIELPTKGDGTLNAHISIMRPEELESIGGQDKIVERGHLFRYTLGPLKEVKPHGWTEMSRVWMIEAHSPDLMKLRRSYGLSSLPNNDKFKFHITVAVKRRKVTNDNELSVKR